MKIEKEIIILYLYKIYIFILGFQYIPSLSRIVTRNKPCLWDHNFFTEMLPRWPVSSHTCWPRGSGLGSCGTGGTRLSWSGDRTASATGQDTGGRRCQPGTWNPKNIPDHQRMTEQRICINLCSFATTTETATEDQ